MVGQHLTVDGPNPVFDTVLVFKEIKEWSIIDYDLPPILAQVRDIAKLWPDAQKPTKIESKFVLLLGALVIEDLARTQIDKQDIVTYRRASDNRSGLICTIYGIPVITDKGFQARSKFLEGDAVILAELKTPYHLPLAS